jgi:hypothetical protein
MGGPATRAQNSEEQWERYAKRERCANSRAPRFRRRSTASGLDGRNVDAPTLPSLLARWRLLAVMGSPLTASHFSCGAPEPGRNVESKVPDGKARGPIFGKGAVVSQVARRALSGFGLAQVYEETGRTRTSEATFPDGAAWRVEIPSVEGPEAFQAVLDEAAKRNVVVHRVSQGSGVALLSDAELREMAEMGRGAGVEVVLWAGARAAWDISAMARSSSGASAAASVRGARGISSGLEEALRAAEAGVDGVLMADIGLLWALGRAKQEGLLPAEFVLKTSIALPALNPASAKVYADLGATSINLPTDLPIEDISAIRQAVPVPLDCYIEGADDFAAPMRYHEIGEIVMVAAPVNLKFGLRNVAGVYPAGGHLSATVISASRERVRRAALGLEALSRLSQESTVGGPSASR